MASFPILPCDLDAAIWLAQNQARLQRLGKPRPLLDGMIAAVAVTNGLILVTRNSKGFVG